MEKWKRWKK